MNQRQAKADFPRVEVQGGLDHWVFQKERKAEKQNQKGMFPPKQESAPVGVALSTPLAWEHTGEDTLGYLSACFQTHQSQRS